jgi:hypothetical protein
LASKEEARSFAGTLRMTLGLERSQKMERI